MSKGKLSPIAALKAKCADCMCHWEDGQRDCCVTSCPLYSFNRFAKMEPDLEWLNWNPYAKGIVEKKTRELTEDQKKELAERLKKARESRKDLSPPSDTSNPSQ